jgi:hypothetical protein
MDQGKIQVMDRLFIPGIVNEKGWFAYKVFKSYEFGAFYPIPKHWIVKEGHTLTLASNKRLCREETTGCAIGIHFGNISWISNYIRLMDFPNALGPPLRIFVVFLPEKNLKNIVVPNLDEVMDRGKGRTNELYLWKELPIRAGQELMNLLGEEETYLRADQPNNGGIGSL